MAQLVGLSLLPISGALSWEGNWPGKLLSGTWLSISVHLVLLMSSLVLYGHHHSGSNSGNDEDGM